MGVHGSNFDMSQVKEFYDPHPCPHGALFGVPTEVKETLDALNGQSISIREALDRIKTVITTGKVGVHTKKNYIGLEVHYDDGRYDVGHTFCLIKFR